MTATGVVIVHGIGSQPQSETLRWFAEPLIEWLDAWHRARARRAEPHLRFRVEASHLSYGGALEPSEPARIELALPAFATWPERRWVIAEAWWASRIEAPALGKMLEWSALHLWLAVQAVLRETLDRILLLLRQGELRERMTQRAIRYEDPGRAGALLELVALLLLSVAYVLLTPFAALLLALAWALSLLPIALLQRFLLTRVVGPFLTESFGDFAVYATDEVQALHIRHKVEETIDWLVSEAGCEDIVVIAHSQGTVVAFDALVGGHLRHRERVRKLITVGAALNRAWLLAPRNERLRDGTLEDVYWLDIWSFYDFVHGGKLKRDAAAPLVRARREVRERLRWPAQEPDSEEVSNRMNLLTEHGAYWTNREQIVSRIAQEIDRADGHRWDSRFFFTDEDERVRRRRSRVTTLVGWRLIALAGFFLAVGTRLATGASFAAAGRALRASLGWLPGAEGVVGALVAAVGWVRAIAGPGFDPEPWVMRTLAFALFAASFTVAHALLARWLWDPWNAAEARRSVLPDLDPRARPDVWRRTAAVAAVIAALTVLVARWSP